MIGYLKGKIIDKNEKTVIILINNVGYTLFIPEKEINFIKIDSENEFYTELIVRENEMTLYGFLTRDEKEMFNLLNEVSGIGPKSSIAIISFMEINSFSKAVINEDLNLLIKLPGVGKKTAQRIILDIKEKLVKRGPFGDEKNSEDDYPQVQNGKLTDVFDTLEALGYSNREILKLLPEMEKNEDLTEQEMIKKALKILSGR